MEDVGIVVIVVVIAIAGVSLLRLSRRPDSSRVHSEPHEDTSAVRTPVADSHDSDRRFSEEQQAQPQRPLRYDKELKAVMAGDLKPTTLFNRSEYRVLLLLEKIVRDMNSGYRVMGQTCMGEIMEHPNHSTPQKDRDAYYAINCKRLDFLVINAHGNPILAVEYHGFGHDRGGQGEAATRDAIKRAALKGAAIPFLEIPAEYNQDETQSKIISILQSA